MRFSYKTCIIGIMAFILSIATITPVAGDVIKYSKTYVKPTANVGTGAVKLRLKTVMAIEQVLESHMDEIKSLKMDETVRIDLPFDVADNEAQSICDYIHDLTSNTTGYLYGIELQRSTTADQLVISHKNIEIECSKQYNLDKNMDILVEMIKQRAVSAKSKKTFELSKVNRDLSDDAIHDIKWYQLWSIGKILAENCDYNYSAIGKDQPADKPKLLNEVNHENVDNDYAWSAYAVMKDRTAVCSGVAAFVVMCCDRLDIPCIRVVGKRNNEADSYHAWNEVYIDNEWYVVDFTDIIGEGKVDNSDAFATATHFSLLGYMWSEFDTEITKVIKYPELYNTESKIEQKINMERKKKNDSNNKTKSKITGTN